MILAVLLYIFLSILLSVIAFSLANEGKDYMFFSPKSFYDNSEMNVLGCILSSSLCFVLAPLYCILATVICSIYKICHIGRKDN